MGLSIGGYVGVVRFAVVAAAPFGEGDGVAVLLRVGDQGVHLLRPVGVAWRGRGGARPGRAGVEMEAPNDIREAQVIERAGGDGFENRSGVLDENQRLRAVRADGGDERVLIVAPG